MDFHNIESFNRARLLDWMLSVFHAFKCSSHQTFFLAVQIIDRYFVAKMREGEALGEECLYLTGITAILMSSKFEDVK
jgi:Cyclin, N-terminal domain